jgi:hypothetical protein
MTIDLHTIVQSIVVLTVIYVLLTIFGGCTRASRTARVEPFERKTYPDLIWNVPPIIAPGALYGLQYPEPLTHSVQDPQYIVGPVQWNISL